MYSAASWYFIIAVSDQMPVVKVTSVRDWTDHVILIWVEAVESVRPPSRIVDVTWRVSIVAEEPQLKVWALPSMVAVRW